MAGIADWHWNSWGNGGLIPLIGSPDLNISETLWGRDNPNVGWSQSSGLSGGAAGNTTPAAQATQANLAQPNVTYSKVPITLKNDITGGGGGGVPNPKPNPNPLPNPGDGGYGDYLASLDAQIPGLQTQRSAQEQVANNSYNQGLNTLTNQYNTGTANLDANRQKTLRDLATNMQNMWQQGNSYLGTRGASDSSAANQYSYALTKLGSQQRGDVQSQYDQNLFQLKNTYDTESKNLGLARDSALQQIAGWYADAVNQLASAKGQAKLQQGQQAYNTAMQWINQVNQQMANNLNTLNAWAANKATSIQQLQTQMAANGNFVANTPQINNLFGNVGSTANTGAVTGYGTTDTRKRDMFGNIIG